MKKSKRAESLPELCFEDLKDSLIQALDHADRKLTSKVIRLPDPIMEMSPAQIRGIRTSLKVSQTVFAAILNVPAKTAISWESGLRRPSRAALRLLDIAKRHPEVLVGD